MSRCENIFEAITLFPNESLSKNIINFHSGGYFLWWSSAVKLPAISQLVSIGFKLLKNKYYAYIIIILQINFEIRISSAGIYTRGCQETALASFKNLGVNYENPSGKMNGQTKTYRIKDRLIFIEDQKISSESLPKGNLTEIPGICFEVRIFPN